MTAERASCMLGLAGLNKRQPGLAEYDCHRDEMPRRTRPHDHEKRIVHRQRLRHRIHHRHDEIAKHMNKIPFATF